MAWTKITEVDLVSCLPLLSFSTLCIIFASRSSLLAFIIYTRRLGPYPGLRVPMTLWRYEYRTIPHHCLFSCQTSRSHARYDMTPRLLSHQFSSLSYNVFSTVLFLFIDNGFTASPTPAILLMTQKGSRAIRPKLAGSRLGRSLMKFRCSRWHIHIGQY